MPSSPPSPKVRLGRDQMTDRHHGSPRSLVGYSYVYMFSLPTPSYRDLYRAYRDHSKDLRIMRLHTLLLCLMTFISFAPAKSKLRLWSSTTSQSNTTTPSITSTHTQTTATTTPLPWQCASTPSLPPSRYPLFSPLTLIPAQYFHLCSALNTILSSGAREDITSIDFLRKQISHLESSCQHGLVPKCRLGGSSL